MNVLIIEDEPNAAGQLKAMILACRPLAQFAPVLDTLEAAVGYLSSDQPVDLIFLDIHLSDGYAFDLFERIEVTCPVIFSTAYDQYAIKAFELNGIDYLLKPMSEERVCKAIAKFERQAQTGPHRYPDQFYQELQKLVSSAGQYRETFLIPFKDKLLPVLVKDFAWFEIQKGVITGTRLDGVTYVLEERSLDELAKCINPRQFYRANRQFLINKAALKEVVQYFNGKLLVKLMPEPGDKVVISREKVTQFKSWVTA